MEWQGEEKPPCAKPSSRLRPWSDQILGLVLIRSLKLLIIQAPREGQCKQSSKINIDSVDGAWFDARLATLKIMMSLNFKCKAVQRKMQNARICSKSAFNQRSLISTIIMNLIPIFSNANAITNHQGRKFRRQPLKISTNDKRNLNSIHSLDLFAS